VPGDVSQVLRQIARERRRRGFGDCSVELGTVGGGE
jgi:hypothetical protein